ncbi:breast cancer type 2 susceptibility protein homolog [Galleria mellonella]|uniref:Breast cancer type 2 susceptibility protein homolog n=1 Tax=Galleria mellonella TaxID=7137 RepID=A0ABM3MCT5_GALME|nr:breast cancer type 2 susceptibility protein homolog [Galleria mellonella]
MDNSEVINSFQESLKRHASRRKPLIYNSSKDDNSTVTTHQYNNPKSILSHISSQIQALQTADCIKRDRDKKKMEKCNNTHLVPVNMLPLDDELPQQENKASKFETQFVLDTQLIEFIDKAENNNNEEVKTEEFKTFFNKIPIEPFNGIISDKYQKYNNESNIKNTDQISNQNVLDNIGIHCLNTKSVDSFKKDNSNEDDSNSIHNLLQDMNQCDIHFKEKYLVDQTNLQLEENCTELIDKCMEIESNINRQDSPERNASPVLNITKNLNTRSKSTSPLIYNLDCFEKFERIAYPIIEQNSDVTSVKHLINSQIVGKELVIQTNFETKLEVSQELSPVIKFKNNKLKTSKMCDSDVNIDVQSDESCNLSEIRVDMPLALSANDFISKENIKDLNSKVEDELLFSSDEEIECIHENKQDLPFTCVVQTSFYDQSDILDKTMYVGFQTASNKSIQISTASFTKAKSLLDGVDQRNSINNPTLSELVEMCDSFSPKHDKTSVLNVKRTEISKNQSDESKMKADCKICDISKEFENVNMDVEIDNEKFIGNNDKNKINKICQDIDSIDNGNTDNSRGLFETAVFPEKRKYGSFITASNKKIKLSDKALKMCRRVFQDIDLSKDFNVENKDLKINMINTRKMADKYKTSDNIKFTEHQMNVLDLNLKADHRSVYKRLDDDVMINNILQDFETEMLYIEKNGNQHINKDFIGFKTANNGDIKISETAMAKSRKIFEDINFCDKLNDYFVNTKQNCDIQNNAKILDQTQNINHTLSSFTGFKTASNKHIPISEEALAKSKSLLRDIEIDKYATEVKSAETEVKNLINEVKRENASGYLCNDILAHIKETTHDGFSKDSNKTNQIKIETDKNNEQINSLGFRTASNKIIEISEDALIKTKKIFNDIDNSEVGISKRAPEKIYEVNFEKRAQINNLKFVGFQTANNKNIPISKQALAKTKTIFQDINYSDAEDLSCKVINDLNKLHCKNKIEQEDIGLLTANNKSVNISTEALAKSKHIFQDINKDNDNLPNQFDIEQNALPFLGFETASNKKVIISENALEKSSKLLKESDLDVKIDQINFSGSVNINDIKKFSDAEKNNFQGFGFKTANNKHIKVSKDALKKSRKIFADLEKDSTVLDIQTVEGNKENVTKNHNISLEKLINTQVINNFDETLYTEDFLETPKQSKRPGSPILSCPKPKKRKQFVTPYRNDKSVTLQTPEVNTGKHEQLNLKSDYNYKKIKNITLKDIKVLETGDKKDNIDPYFLKFTFNTLLEFEFSGDRNELTDTKMDMQSLKNYFLKDVSKKLIPDKWLDNHLKLILWKLISYEVKFPNVMIRSCTAGNVLKQLQYRYQRELYNAERPALRKILERDDTAAKCLVLCVVDIIDGKNKSEVCTNTELLLSDGWYCIRACVDKILIKYLRNGKIKIGTKLMTYGAELLNCEQGVAPWEDTSAVRLKIYGNSTRRARWDARLGYHGNGAILSRLSTVAPDGGKVGRIRVLVTRVYPPLYVEKFEDGSTLTRSERLEYIHQMKHEADRQALMEKLYEEVEKKLSDEESPESLDIDSSKKSMDSGSQIARQLKHSKDPSEFKTNLTESQRNILEEYNARKRDKLLQDIHDRVKSKMDSAGITVARNTVPLLKVRIADVEDRNGNVEVTKALLSIWKPNDALSEMITEGAWIEVLNVVPTAVRYSELQLSAGRQTTFKQITIKHTEKLKPYITSMVRTCYSITQLANNPSMITNYNEVDTVGMIIQIDPQNRDFKSNNQFQNVYIADENKNIICVNFWGGIKKFGFENVLDTGQIISCVNLQRRTGNTRRGVPQYRATEFTYFTKTPKSVATRKLMEDLVNNIGVNKDFIDDCVKIKDNKLLSSRKNENNVTPYRFENHDSRKYVDSPLATRMKQEDFNLTGLDFESTFKQTETQELSPRTLERKKKVNEKINKLKQYGEPPPLCPLNIINKSKNAAKSYRSPLLKSDVTNVANIKQTPRVANTENTAINSFNQNISCSPVLSIKKTFRNVNPVKLNFNSVATDESKLSNDEFEGEFNGSPPLSLD